MRWCALVKKYRDFGVKVTVLIFTSVIAAIAMNDFLIPSNIFSGGMNGVAQLCSYIVGLFHIKITTGWFILLINIPIGIVGYKIIGPKFTIWSFIDSILTSVIMIVVPTHAVSNNALLNALFGGILGGVSIGLTFKYGFSTGGLDIISMILQRTTGKSIGSLNMILNSAITIISGFMIGWQNALYTIITIYATSRMVDVIHTRYQKMTAFIVTEYPDQVICNLKKNLVRGVTVISSRGGYSDVKNTVLMTVISRYELYDLRRSVKEADEHSFINITSTIDVIGNFASEEDQQKMHQALMNNK